MLKATALHDIRPAKRYRARPLLIGRSLDDAAVAADNPNDPNNPNTDLLIFTVGAAVKRDVLVPHAG
jgi:hypothetical protein